MKRNVAHIQLWNVYRSHLYQKEKKSAWKTSGNIGGIRQKCIRIDQMKLWRPIPKTGGITAADPPMWGWQGCHHCLLNIKNKVSIFVPCWSQNWGQGALKPANLIQLVLVFKQGLDSKQGVISACWSRY